MGGPKDGQMDRRTAMYYSLLKADNFMVVCFGHFMGILVFGFYLSISFVYLFCNEENSLVDFVRFICCPWQVFPRMEKRFS